MITCSFDQYAIIASAIAVALIAIYLVRDVFVSQAAVTIKNTNRVAFYRLPSHRQMMLHPKYWMCWTASQFGRKLK